MRAGKKREEKGDRQIGEWRERNILYNWEKHSEIGCLNMKERKKEMEKESIECEKERVRKKDKTERVRKKDKTERVWKKDKTERVRKKDKTERVRKKDKTERVRQVERKDRMWSRKIEIEIER